MTTRKKKLKIWKNSLGRLYQTHIKFFTLKNWQIFKIKKNHSRHTNTQNMSVVINIHFRTVSEEVVCWKLLKKKFSKHHAENNKSPERDGNMMMKICHICFGFHSNFSLTHYENLYIFDAYGVLCICAKYRWKEVINMISKCAAAKYLREVSNPPCTYMKINQ